MGVIMTDCVVQTVYHGCDNDGLCGTVYHGCDNDGLCSTDCVSSM